MSWKPRRCPEEPLNQAERVTIAGESELDVRCLGYTPPFFIDNILGDGPQMRDRICSACVGNKVECTYRNPAPPRTFSLGYVKTLEERFLKVEALLKKVRPDSDFAEELGFPLRSANPPSTQSLVNVPFTPVNTLSALSSTIGPDDDTPPLSDDEVLDPIKLSRVGLSRKSDGEAPILFGKSSVVDLVQRMYDVQSDVSGAPRRLVVRYVRQHFNWMPSWVDEHRNSVDVLRYCLFPEPDLMARLVERYFSEHNIIFPLLHRPTFEKALRTKQYLSDGGFARVLLLVCAVGSRYVDDPRVLLESGARHSAGWKWFEQAHIAKLHLLVAPTLYDMQAHCLSIEYLHSSSTPQVCWSMTAIGIRMIQDVGANRRAVYAEEPNASDELWKRVFWLLVFYDRFHSTGVGRSCAIPEEDYDVDPPIDCDDEYWEHEDPERAFKQPPGKPSTISAFVAFTRLQFVTALALRTLFSLSRSKAALGLTGPNWEQDMVAKLDSALNMWLDAIPEHLRWDTGKEITNEIFYRQSNLLQCGYYLVQITIHRQFVTSRGGSSPLTVSSRTVCRSAARACITAMHQYIERGFSVLPEQLPLAFMSGLILMLSSWGRTLSDSAFDAQQDMETIKICIEILDRCESRYYIAGRQSHDLREVASFEGIPRWLTSLRTLGAHARETDVLVTAPNRDVQVHHEQFDNDTPLPSLPKPPRMAHREHQSNIAEGTSSQREDDALAHATSLMNKNGEISQMTPGEIAVWSSAPSAGWSEDWDMWIRGLGQDEFGDPLASIY